MTNLFDFRWNVKAGTKVGLLVDHGHFELELVDFLYDIVKELGVENQVLPGHRRTRMIDRPLRFGSYYFLQTWANRVSGYHSDPALPQHPETTISTDGPKPYESQITWLERVAASITNQAIKVKVIYVQLS
jgi:hypothetical protein